jgi:hypothetical protein
MVIKPKDIRIKPNILGAWTYITLTGDSEKEAMEYLRAQDDPPLFHYIAIETPEGTFCRDVNGIYKE